MRLVYAIALSAAIAFGQPAGHGAISGTVVEASSGEPVRKAIVTLTLQGEPKQWATARTDGAGQFTFTGLPAGKYDLSAAKQGLGTATYGAKAAGETGELITLENGENRGGLKLLFIQSASITGHVFDVDGEPLANVLITARRMGRDLGKRVLVNDRGTVADDRGEYRLRGLNPGDYYLLVNPVIGGARFGQEPALLLIPQYYGGSREWKDSTVLHIRGGESLTGVDFHLTAEPPHRIHGHVTGVPDLGSASEPEPSGRGVYRRFESEGNGIEMQLTPAGDGSTRWQSGSFAAAPDFAFEFDNLPGDIYRIEGHVDVGGKRWAASQLLDTRSLPDEIVLTLAPAIDIKGQLRIEGGAGRSVSDIEVGLTRQGFRGEPVSDHPAADGSFTLKQVTAGDWVVNLNSLPPGAFLKSVFLGDKDVRFVPFTIGAAAAGPLNIVVSTRSAKVTGEVDAGGGDSKRAGIVLAPIGPLHDLARFYYGSVSDDNGKFHFTHVAPGKYRIFALERLAPQRFRNPEAADQLGDLGTEIELTEGAALVANPKLIPTERAREALNSEAHQ